MKRVALSVVLVAACAGPDPVVPLRPVIDLAPVGCGYKWFQSGYGPTLRIPCEQDRAPFKQAQTALARDHAWEIARTRCPAACGPVELQDTSGSIDRFPDGVCRDGYAYFSTRIFFRCGEP
jgi:hypothetical protein